VSITSGQLRVHERRRLDVPIAWVSGQPRSNLVAWPRTQFPSLGIHGTADCLLTSSPSVIESQLRRQARAAEASSLSRSCFEVL
jgi:hypothetical protein